MDIRKVDLAMKHLLGWRKTRNCRRLENSVLCWSHILFKQNKAQGLQLTQSACKVKFGHFSLFQIKQLTLIYSIHSTVKFHTQNKVIICLVNMPIINKSSIFLLINRCFKKSTAELCSFLFRTICILQLLFGPSIVSQLPQILMYKI